VRWNLEKSYLTELAARGAPVPASAIVEADAASWPARSNEWR